MPYTKLFTPGKIANLEIRNRIVMPAMGCSLAEVTGEPGPRMIKYYADRARGGAGLIITEITRVDDETGVGTPNQLSVTNTHVVGQISRLAETLHAYDTKLFIQLHHPGNQTPSRLIGGKQPVSAVRDRLDLISVLPQAVHHFPYGVPADAQFPGQPRAFHGLPCAKQFQRFFPDGHSGPLPFLWFPQIISLPGSIVNPLTRYG